MKKIKQLYYHLIYKTKFSFPFEKKIFLEGFLINSTMLILCLTSIIFYFRSNAIFFALIAVSSFLYVLLLSILLISAEIPKIKNMRNIREKLKKQIHNDLRFLKNNVDKIVIEKSPITYKRDYQLDHHIKLITKNTEETIINTENLYQLYNDKELFPLLNEVEEIISNIKQYEKNKKFNALKDLKKNFDPKKALRRIKEKQKLKQNENEEDLLKQQRKNFLKDKFIEEEVII